MVSSRSDRPNRYGLIVSESQRRYCWSRLTAGVSEIRIVRLCGGIAEIEK